ncbi:MAG TPA: hypothetical protein VMU54_02530 [Planctomycetota bacterium]|nr:hypothetical protein [Planctomycetota bacterium]
MPVFDDLAYWWTCIDAAPAESWKEVRPDALDAQVRADSEYWCRQQLVSDALPYLPGRKEAIAASPSAEGTPHTPVRLDLLRHRYKVDDFDLELVEGRNFTLLRLPAPRVLQGSTAQRGAEIHRLARMLMTEPWTFLLPGTIGEGIQFTSNPDVLPDETFSWKERGDGGIRAGKLWFLCSRRIPDIVGFHNGMQWFSDEFRGQLLR